jgi:hypothetical protein
LFAAFSEGDAKGGEPVVSRLRGFGTGFAAIGGFVADGSPPILLAKSWAISLWLNNWGEQTNIDPCKGERTAAAGWDWGNGGQQQPSRQTTDHHHPSPMGESTAGAGQQRMADVGCGWGLGWAGLGKRGKDPARPLLMMADGMG